MELKKSMNEHEWYSAKPDLQPADDWYKPRTETISAASKKKHRRVKILSLCLVFAILAGLSAAVFMNHRAKDTSADTEQSFPSDYKEYFRETYPTSEEASPVLIQKTAYTGSAQMNLVGGDSEVLTLQEVYQQNINSVAAVYSFLPSGAGGFMGTAIVISEDGLLITNAHVLEGCNSCYVILNGNSKYEAQLIGSDSTNDIAILKIPATDLDPATFGDSSELQVGDAVAAIGNPLERNLSGTFTNGIVSAIDRTVQYNGHTLTMIQTNAAINNGNSGGPLLDMHGHVVGIVNMKRVSTSTSVEGIGFALPTAAIVDYVNELIRTGTISGRPSIGILVMAVPDEVRAYYELPAGLYILQVYEKTDAKAQGLEAGDIITKANGADVRTTEDLANIKADLETGDTIALTLWRDGAVRTREIRLIELSAYT